MRKALSFFVLFIACIFVTPLWADEWKSLESPNFQVFYKKGGVKIAQKLLLFAEKKRRRVSAFIGYDFKHKTKVYLAPDRKSYSAVQPRAIIPEWSVGVAFIKENTIVIYTPGARAKEAGKYDMNRVFIHELSHIFMGKGIPGRETPRWIDEGVAQYLAVEWSKTDSFRLTLAYILGRLIPLEELMYSWPKEGRKARLAYLQSRTLVGYLARQRSLRDIIALLIEGKTGQEAVMLSTGMTIRDLERHWKEYIGKVYTWIFLFFRPEFIWTFMALLFLAAYWRVRVRSRKKLKKMALEEEMEDFHRGDGPTWH